MIQLISDSDVEIIIQNSFRSNNYLDFLRELMSVSELLTIERLVSIIIDFVESHECGYRYSMPITRIFVVLDFQELRQYSQVIMQLYEAMRNKIENLDHLLASTDLYK